jgi:probable phosphoglycerate mutase
VALLHGIRFDRVLTSPRQHAVQTCARAGFRAQVVSKPDLAERNYGAHESKRSAEIRQETRAEPSSSMAAWGETPRQIPDGVERAFERVAHSPGTIALFSHGYFGSALAARKIVVVSQSGRAFLA